MERSALPTLKIALGYGVKHSHGLKGHAPLTRMAIADLLRRQFEGALLYEQNRAVDACKFDPDQEILLSALKRKRIVRAHCMRSDDIATALRIAREFGLKLVLEHALAADAVLDQIASSQTPVVFGPAWRTLGNSDEIYSESETAKNLFEAGVQIALMTDHPIVPEGFLPILAGLTVRSGLDPEDALRLITSNAAQILGIEDRLGVLKENHLADFLIISGPPLEIATRVLDVFIEGKRIDFAQNQSPFSPFFSRFTSASSF